ncbi:MAG: ABC-2 family transporter protein [Caldilineaceae bacterium]
MQNLNFLLALWKVNLLSILEYRVAFLTQMLGMIFNNAVYFVFWIIFFDRFEQVNGWGIDEMYFLFAVVAVGFGLGAYLFGNVLHLANIVVTGQLDYYLSLPKPVLLHVLASRSIASGVGDFVYGLLSFGVGVAVIGGVDVGMIARFVLASLLATLIFVSFLVLVQSLAFWIGNANLLLNNALSAIITFSLYPITLFDGSAKLLLFTLIPAAFVGAVPAQIVRQFEWPSALQMLAAAAIFFGLAMVVFHRGLRRYESGSAIQVRM